MITKNEIEELLVKLKIAKTPSRELDFYVARAVGWHGSNDYTKCSWLAHPDDKDGSDAHCGYLYYTRLVDAAFTLLQGRLWSIGCIINETETGYVVILDNDGMSYRGATPAIAFCIAALTSLYKEILS